jgi:acetoin utilization protein AcuB
MTAPRAKEGRDVIVMQVRQIMTPRVVTVTPDTTVGEARRLLEEHRIRHLPVLVNGRIVGIVSDRDLRSAGGANGSRTVVAGVMTPRPVTVTSDTRVEEAARLLLSRRIGGLPVVDGHELVGIVTGDDLLRALVAVIESATLERISVDFAGRRDA